MRAPWRPLAFAAALNLTVVVGVTTAQTVLVTKAPRGAAIELALNADIIGTATADNAGRATFPVNLSSRGGRTEADVQIFVDVCGDLRRVLLVEPGLQPELPQIGCTRRELTGVFLMRQITTIVVEVTASSPAVWLRQGPVPEAWLGEQSGSISTKRGRWPSPTGLVLSGAGGLTKVTNATAVACGNVTDCSDSGSGLAFAAGAAVWVTQFLAADATYQKPTDATVRGSDPYYNFINSLDTTVFTVAGKVGIPLGAFRPYAHVGGAYHRATSTTSETIYDRTYLDADGAVQLVEGGTQVFVLKTTGWGWVFGGGLEVWLAPKFGIYGEAERAQLKGPSSDGNPGEIDDWTTTFRVGVRVRLLGK